MKCGFADVVKLFSCFCSAIGFCFSRVFLTVSISALLRLLLSRAFDCSRSGPATPAAGCPVALASTRPGPAPPVTRSTPRRQTKPRAGAARTRPDGGAGPHGLHFAQRHAARPGTGEHASTRPGAGEHAAHCQPSRAGEHAPAARAMRSGLGPGPRALAAWPGSDRARRSSGWAASDARP